MSRTISRTVSRTLHCPRIKMPRLTVNSPRSVIYTTAAVTTVSLCSFFEILPHAFCIERYRKIIAKYKREVEVPVHKDVEKLFNEVLDDLKVKPKLRTTYKPFTITGFDTYYAGVNNSPYGVIIGIPGHFVYKDKRTVDILDIRIGHDREPLNPYDPATDQLVESFVLSDKAKKYGLAREVLMSQKNLPLYRSLETPLLVSTSAVMADVLKRQYNIFQKPFPVVILAYVGLGLMSFATWFQLRDELTTYFEYSVDKELAALGPDYVEGGKEFYEKLLQRNLALRKLLGPHGPSQYNLCGDQIKFIRQKHIPPTQRKRFFENYSSMQAIEAGESLAA